MTGRELLLNTLHGGARDRLTWATYIDGTARASLPQREREMPLLDVYRQMGCDIMQWGNGGLEEHQRFHPGYRMVSPHVQVRVERLPDGSAVTHRDTDWGTLTAVSRSGHPVKQPVTSVQEVAVLRRIWESMRYEPVGEPDGFAPAFAAIGEDGILSQTMSPSPMQLLIQLETGIEGFYYLLADHRREMEALLEIMHARRLEEYRIALSRSQADVIIPVENTSSTLTSPAVYERYGMPQVRDYVEIIHAHGKVAVLHMCGLLSHLLPVIARTELDGINALTPAPVGDTPFDEALDVLGEDLVILGGVFPPEVLHRTSLTAGELARTLDAIYTPRVRRSRFLLCLGVDGLRVDLDRFEMFRRWFEANGAITAV